MLNTHLKYSSPPIWSKGKRPAQLVKIFIGLLIYVWLPAAAFGQNPTPPNLGTAANFGLLSGGSISSNSSVYVYGSIGAINPVGVNILAKDSVYTDTDALLTQALQHLDSARNYCASLTGTSINGTLNGQSLTEGVYNIVGNATLNSTQPFTVSGDSQSVVIINISDSLDILPNASVILDGVRAENIYWNIGGALSLDSGTIFFGVVLVAGNISKSGSQFGRGTFLSLSDISLLDLDVVNGNSIYYSYSYQAYFNQLPPCQQSTQISCPENQAIKNGGFETLVDACPAGAGNIINLACHWESANGADARYYNMCANGGDPDIPTNNYGFQNTMVSPSGWNAYAGIMALHPGSPNRQYLKQTIDVLDDDRWYYGEFYINKANNGRWAVSTISMYVSPNMTSSDYNGLSGNGEITDINNNPIIAQINNTNGLLNDEDNWLKIFGIFPANGNETQVTIGNFSVGSTGAQEFPPGANYGFYYIDNVSLNKLPAAGDDRAICAGLSTILGADCNAIPAGSGGTYSWSHGLGTSSSINATLFPSVSPNSTTTYTLWVTVGTTSYQSFCTVTVNPLPNVTITASSGSNPVSSTNPVCAGQSVTLTASGANTYSWYPMQSFITGPIRNVIVNSTTWYDVKGVTAAGCSANATIQIPVIPKPVANAIASPTTICAGSTSSLSAYPGQSNTVTISSYTWTNTSTLQNISSTGNTATAAPISTVTYSVTPFGANGCVGNPVPIQITVTPNPNLVVTPICNQDGTTSFSATGATTYTWTGPGIPASPATTGNGYSTPGAVGQTLTYSVTGVSNNCSTTVAAFTDPCCRLYEVGANGYGDPNSADPAVIVPNTPNGTHTIDASTLGGDVTFEGIYHLTCPLELVGGNFYFNPGTIFYVDAQSNHTASICSAFDLQQGYNFIRANPEVTLHIRATTFQAACDRLWGGIYLENANIVSTAGSVIRDAYIGVASVGIDNTTGACPVDNFNIIELHETYFQDNIYGFWEKDKVNAQPNEAIRDCHFENFGSILPYYPNAISSPLIGVYLERNPGAGNTGYTTNFYNNLTFSGNTIYGFAEYGMFGRANDLVIGPENYFYDNSRSAIAVNAIKGHLVYIKDNTIDVPFSPTIQTTTRIVGVEAEFNTVVDENNVITGTGFTTGTTNFTIGVWAQANQLGTLVDNNQFTDLSFGVQYASTVTALTVTKNLFTDNNNAVSYNSPSASTIVTPHVRCNTIQRVNSNAFMVGIHVGSTTDLADIGTPNTPNGNLFTSITREVNNQGINLGLRYYRYNPSQEAGWVYSFGGGTNLFTDTNIPGSIAACGTNGINMRVTGAGPAAIQQMKDSLRMQVGSAGDMRYYLTEIINYHLADSALVPALEAYTDSLPNAHLFAFTSLSLALMDYHRINGNEAAAQAHKSAVLVYNPADTDLENYCLYFDLTAVLGTTGKPNFVPDSADITLLEQVVNSGAGVATKACRLLQFYRHNSGCYAGPDGRLASATANQWLGQSYPNPNTGSATIPYILPSAVSRASIELRELVTGRLVGAYQLPVKAGEAQLDVNLDRIISGNYVYSLIVDGAGIATGKMVVIK